MTDIDKEPILRVLRQHFPAERMLHIQSAELFWNEITFTHDPTVHGVHIDDQKEQLRNLEKGLRMAMRAIRALHPMVRDKLEKDHAANVESRRNNAKRLVTVDQWTFSDGRIVEKPIGAGDLLNRLHGGLLGEWAADQQYLAKKAPQTNAVAGARHHLSELPVETPQQRKAKSWQKVIFTNKAREVWLEFGGIEAPSRELNPESPFANFMADMIEAIGEEWKPVPTFNAWRRAMDS